MSMKCERVKTYMSKCYVGKTANLDAPELGAKPFENVRWQIGFCGIWCGSCAAGNGATLELARRLDKLVREYELEKWVPRDFDFKEFQKGLASIQAMSTCPGCANGGGLPDCKIKACALGKGISDCGRCAHLLGCGNFEFLEKGNPSIKEELLKAMGKSREELIGKWTADLKTKWPHCVLFLCD